MRAGGKRRSGWSLRRIVYAQVGGVEFVLGRTRQRHIDRNMPWLHAGFELHAGAMGVAADPADSEWEFCPEMDGT